MLVWFDASVIISIPPANIKVEPAIFKLGMKKGGNAFPAAIAAAVGYDGNVGRAVWLVKGDTTH